MTDWYQAKCPECDPGDSGSVDRDCWHMGRVPFAHKARLHKQVHNTTEHAGAEVALVIEQ